MRAADSMQIARYQSRRMERELAAEIRREQRRRNNTRLVVLAAIAAIIAILVLYVLPNTAFAATSDDIRSEIDDAEAYLEDLYAQAEAASEALNQTNAELEQTAADIDATQQHCRETTRRLNEQRRRLSRRIRATYKSSRADLVSLVLGARSFEEFTEAVSYAAHIADSDADSINEAARLRDELAEQLATLAELQQSQKQLQDEQETRKADLQAAAAEQEAYIANLGEELKTAIEAEEEARREAERREAERRAAEEAERRAAEASREAEQAAEQQPEAQTAPAMDADEQEKRKILVDSAYSQLGLPYVWGGKEPGVGMDCSGLVSWCYDQIGIHMPHYHASIAEYVRERRSVEELEPGDVVLWMGGDGSHVAMYIGNNQIIEEIYRGCSINNIYDRMPYTFAGSIL